ncbi:MAG: flagellar biosynthetic protein FliR [Myxococcales bacterium]|nr:flagellar biosynthetic protein FliR [Myxococcales bacterium]
MSDLRAAVEALLSGDVLERGAWVAARVAPLTVFVPWLGLRGLPSAVRAGLTVVLTLALAPLAWVSMAPLPASTLAWGVTLLRELTLGAAFALVAALPFEALRWSGQVTDAWRGASLSDLVSFGGAPSSPLGELFALFGVVLFFGLGGHLLALRAFADTLVAAPVGAVALDATAGWLMAARVTGDALALAVAFAAPAAVWVVSIELTLGLVGRAAPQLPVYFAGMPLRAAAGIAAAFFSVALLAQALPHAFRDAIAFAARLLDALAH